MKLLRNILSSVWMIDPREAETLLPMVQSMLNGVSIDFSSYVVKSQVEGYQTPENQKRVVVIPIQGIIMKYDFCGDLGMMTLEWLLDQYMNDPEIGAVVLDIDSGGGQATFLDHVANKVNEFRSVKPILTHFSGICASAAYYVASNTTKIYASSVLDEVGSIGTMCSFNKPNPNSTSAYELVSFYAADSVDKNRSYRDALEGKPAALIDELGKYNNEFKAQVLKGRPNIDQKALTGICIYSDEAIKIGMIDGIKRLDDVISEAFSLIK